MPTLYQLIENLTVSTLKELLAYFPDACKVGRKDVLVASLLEEMSGASLLRAWEQLDPCQRLAVSEATHDAHGIFNGARFAAKYGEMPAFFHLRGTPPYQSRGAMTVLGLFIYDAGGLEVIPKDLAARLKAFVPKPAPNTLATIETVPEFDDDDEPFTVRSTASDALHDVVVMLRAVDQNLIAVSEKTRLPGVAALGLVTGKLAGGDFYELVAPEDDWGQQIGPIKALAWPLLLQGGGLAQLNGGKLKLTPAGVKALQAESADVVCAIWRAWLTSTLHDEFSRVDEIKGQKGKGRMTETAPRRATIAKALALCPVDTWVSVDEWARFMRAEGFPLEICHYADDLYIGDPNYGSLAYAREQRWDALQMRYLLCVLFEYCATLGMVDVVYRSPHDARDHFQALWGTDDMTFLSRYDGLMYFRLTALGAFCLGVTDNYAPPERALTCTWTVKPNLQVSVTEGALSADDRLMLDNWAVEESALVWRLDRERAIAAIERGHDPAQLEAFLQARDSQPLPEQVTSFLRTCSKQGKAMKVLAASLLIECVDAGTADLIAANKATARLCMRAGERHLVVRLDQESKFRKAARLLGYGIPA